MAVDDEYVCLTVVSKADEDLAAFGERLSLFWTHMLRQFPDDFEKVYAETIEFEEAGDRHERQYLCEEAAVAVVTREMTSQGIDHKEVDFDDRWSKYEASPSEWWQIEH